MSNGKKPAKAGDESYAVLQSLIAKGRKEGMLRASELNAELEKSWTFLRKNRRNL